MTETWPVIGVVGEIEKRRKRASEREGPPFFLLLPLFARQKNALYLYFSFSFILLPLLPSYRFLRRARAAGRRSGQPR